MYHAADVFFQIQSSLKNNFLSRSSPEPNKAPEQISSFIFLSSISSFSFDYFNVEEKRSLRAERTSAYESSCEREAAFWKLRSSKVEMFDTRFSNSVRGRRMPTLWKRTADSPPQSLGRALLDMQRSHFEELPGCTQLHFITVQYYIPFDNVKYGSQWGPYGQYFSKKRTIRKRYCKVNDQIWRLERHHYNPTVI